MLTFLNLDNLAMGKFFHPSLPWKIGVAMGNPSIPPSGRTFRLHHCAELLPTEVLQGLAQKKGTGSPLTKADLQMKTNTYSIWQWCIVTSIVAQIFSQKGQPICKDSLR